MNRAVRAGEVLDVARFEAMSREDCIDEWRRTMGGQSLKYVSVQFMRSALAYEAQIKAYGGHSSAVRKALKAALKTDQRSSEAGGRPKPVSNPLSDPEPIWSGSGTAGPTKSRYWMMASRWMANGIAR
jgi:hypothetical protein